MLRHFNELRIAIEPEAAALAASQGSQEQHARITWGLQQLRNALDGEEHTLESDIDFHVAILRATNNPFYAQFRDVVATALRTSIGFTDRIKGRFETFDDHAAVHDAIIARRPERARQTMHKIIADVLDLIASAERGSLRS